MILPLTIILVIIGWISTGLCFGTIINWKKDIILENKWNYLYLGFFGLFLIIDIIVTAVGGTPALVPSCAVYLVASQFRSDEWPKEPKFAEYYKIYIIILSLSLLPALIMIGFSNLMIFYTINPDIYMMVAMGVVFGTMIIPMIIVLGSDPTNRYGNREPEKVIGGLFAILGSSLASVFGFMAFLSGQLIILDTLAIIFTGIGAVASVLIFLCID